MSYIIKNRAKQPVICTMGDGSSLRLPIGGETEVTEKQFKGHLEVLSKIGDISAMESNVPKKPEMKVVKATVEQTGQQNNKGGK